MKKFTTKLLMSIIAVAFAFVALGTSTYAWFSMNTTVTVTGMEIGAKSENTYLLIGTDTNNTAALIQANNSPTTVSVNVADGTKVLPSKPIESTEISSTASVDFANGKYFATGTTYVQDATSAALASNWYTAVSHDPAQAINWSTTDASGDIKKLNAANVTFSDYVIKRTVYLTLAAGSDNAHNLFVTPTIAKKVTDPAQTANDISAVKVLVATGDNVVILSSASEKTSLHATSDFTIDDASVVAVDIYIYYDGSVSTVKTNNVADLAAATISLAFDVELGSAPEPVQP